MENDPSDDPDDTSRELAQRLYGSRSYADGDLDAAQFKAAAERQLTAFTRGLTEELITRLRETAQADPKSPWLRHMLLAGRKSVP